MTVTISGYERFREIGSGGFSRVFEAYEREFSRRVAIKVLNVEGDTGFDRAAFEAECRAMGMVSEHPNIVTVFASGFTGEGAPYIAMERYHDTLLDRVRAADYLPVAEVVDLAVKMAGALHRAHEAGLLHRDVKPQNIFYSKYGEPVLGDFGIAALTRGRADGSQVGFTPSYAAPEVIEGAPPRVESDLYALGATIYTALAGRRPFSRSGDESDDDFYRRICTELPPAITAQHVPGPVHRIVFGLLVKHPTDRPHQALDVGALLRDAQVHLGLPVTPLVLPDALDDDLDTTITTAANRGSLAPGRDELTSSTTVVGRLGKRSTDPADPGSGEPRGPDAAVGRPPGGVNRAMLAAGGLALVVAIAIVGIVAARNGTDDQRADEHVLDTSSTTTLVVTDESPLDTPNQPAIATSADTVEVSWAEVEGAIGYRVAFLSEDRPDELVDRPRLVLATEDIQLPICVQVRATGPAGQLSPFSIQTCSAG